ncbi:MAG: sigma 54-interacting transcriptional regulator [Desulfobacterales bacterium]|nr:sigma 54-interacting transcriptional regulator [Desulfobacterales bacterium]
MRAEDLRINELVSLAPESGFPLFLSHRIMLVSMAGLGRLAKDLVRSFGFEKMDVVFTRFGYEVGMATALTISDLYAFESPVEEFKSVCALTAMAGMATTELKEIDYRPETRHLTFRAVCRDSFEASIWKHNFGPSEEPICGIMAGVLGGFASTVTGIEMLVRETACQTQGHEACVFEGKPVTEWGLQPEEVRQYFAIDTINEELERMRSTIDQARKEVARQSAQIRMLKRQGARPGKEEEGIIFRSESMARVLTLAEKVAPTRSTVLIQGESGTGKEVLAQFIHRRSNRIDDPFLAINCAALPPNLLESELFGHVKGAFTGADSDKRGLFVEAGQGTLFLDEVGELPLELQAKLLRALQEKEVRPVGGVRDLPIHARIIAATNRDLKEMVAGNQFREDLFYRLAVFPLMVTPLRQRRQDILLLARHFLNRQSAQHPGFSPGAVRKMEAYAWPGNVRELENWVEYAHIMAGEERIGPEHLPLSEAEYEKDTVSGLTMDQPTLETLEGRYIRQVLSRTEGNKTETAKILGISISTLWRRLKEEKGK